MDHLCSEDDKKLWDGMKALLGVGEAPVNLKVSSFLPVMVGHRSRLVQRQVSPQERRSSQHFDLLL